MDIDKFLLELSRLRATGYEPYMSGFNIYLMSDNGYVYSLITAVCEYKTKMRFPARLEHIAAKYIHLDHITTLSIQQSAEGFGDMELRRQILQALRLPIII